jgi:hypothetical protein
MSVKRKLLKKAATKIKKKIGSMNSTDNMSNKGPIDKSIGKFGDKVDRELDVKDFKKNYVEAEDAFIFHTGKNNPNHFVNPPKMSQNTAEKILSQTKRLKK